MEKLNIETSNPETLQLYEPPSPLIFYSIKWIKWKNKDFPIITQNENGPCPLLALINALLLMEKFSLPNIIEIITPEQLLEYVADFILTSNIKDIPEEHMINYEQNVQDALALLPKLQTGIDVNIRFTSPRDFEFTPECIIFDFLNIPLYHGWIVDPINENNIALAMSNLTYNQIIDKIIDQKCSEDLKKQEEALILENFLNNTSHQLTYFGLCELNNIVNEGEMIVLFRNNHFSTLTKHKDKLYTLVTDQGYLNEKNVMWETLSTIEGDETFVNGAFQPIQNANTGDSSNQDQVKGLVDTEPTQSEKVDPDYLLAMSLQKEQEDQSHVLQNATLDQSTNLTNSNFDTLKVKYQNPLPLPDSLLTDKDLAIKLQAEEDFKLAQELSNLENDCPATQSTKLHSGSRPTTSDENVSCQTVIGDEASNINNELRKKCTIS